MGVVAKLLGVESIVGSTRPARRCRDCEVGWIGGPYCWVCGTDVRRQLWRGGL